MNIPRFHEAQRGCLVLQSAHTSNSRKPCLCIIVCTRTIPWMQCKIQYHFLAAFAGNFGGHDGKVERVGREKEALNHIYGTISAIPFFGTVLLPPSPTWIPASRTFAPTTLIKTLSFRWGSPPPCTPRRLTSLKQGLAAVLAQNPSEEVLANAKLFYFNR